MKTISVKALFHDGDHFVLPEAELEKYPASMQHEISFKHERFTAPMQLAVGAAINGNAGLYRKDGDKSLVSVADYNLTRSLEILERTVKAVSIKDGDGKAVDLEDLEMEDWHALASDVLTVAGHKIEYKPIPTAESFLAEAQEKKQIKKS